MLTLTSFISPYRKDRDLNREIHEQAGLAFIEIYVKAPLEVCEQRDPKGLYAKARAGEIPEFTGISAPYEEPLKPELVLETDQLSPEQAAQKVLDDLTAQRLIAGTK